jgi:hypothetical protein
MVHAARPQTEAQNELTINPDGSAGSATNLVDCGHVCEENSRSGRDRTRVRDIGFCLRVDHGRLLGRVLNVIVFLIAIGLAIAPFYVLMETAGWMIGQHSFPDGSA